MTEKTQTLYLKYRPQNLDELDLTSVRRSLKKIAKKGKFPHALLFAGPRGTGKTSAARILAKLINCTDKKRPCNSCSQCTSITNGSNIDVVEMDAASHRGIDDIRSLRDSIALAPASAAKKIYIIDEVHMLTTEAFNALLKTLEEPPNHVMFILATTNPEKLPETVKSRLTLVQFSKATQKEIARQLGRVSQKEGLDLDLKTIKIIAQKSSGSFRDAVKLLEQLTIELDEITPEKAKEVLQSSASSTDEFITLLEKKDTKSLLTLTESIVQKGIDLESMIHELVESLRGSLLTKAGLAGEDHLKDLTQKELIKLIKLLTKAQNEVDLSPVPQLPLEIAFIEHCQVNKKSNPIPPKTSAPKKTKSLKIPNTKKPQKNHEPNGDSKPSPNPSSQSPGEINTIWQKVLSSVKNQNTTIDALLKATRPLEFDGRRFKLGVFYQFHKERLETVNNKMALEEYLKVACGSSVRVEYCLEKPKKAPEPPKPSEDTLTKPKDDDIIRVAEEIFS